MSSVFLAIATAILSALAAMQSEVAAQRLLTVVEAAEYLGMSRNAVYIACRENRLPHYRLNDWSIRFDMAELRRWLEDNRRGPVVES